MTRFPSLLRARAAHEHSKVTFIELFFDLVFVFAVTQLSHALLEDLTPGGAMHATLLLMAVWWVWIYTSWVTNWLDPQRTPVRLLLLGLMLAGLLLSTSVPKAFESRGLAFAAAYASMQIGRSAFMLWALGSGNSGLKVNFQRIISWLGLAGMLWIAGGLAEGDARLVLWSIALLLEYVAPSIGFWVPGMGRSRTSDWNVEGHHLAERCGLFIIIALGESILVTGATFGELAWSSTTVAAFVVAFVGSVAMWWIYFDSGAERGSAHIAGSSDPGRMARLAYTYLHLPIVAGIIVAAVADELLLAHPAGHADPPTIAAALGGPALFLLGTALFKATTARRFPLSHLVGLVLLALLSLVAAKMATLVLGAASTLVLVLVAAWERRSLRGKSSESAGA